MSVLCMFSKGLQMVGSDCHTHFECIGKEACADAIIDGTNGIDISLSCVGVDACKTLTMLCGIGKCELFCSDDTSCQGIAIITDVAESGTFAASFTCTGLIILR